MKGTSVKTAAVMRNVRRRLMAVALLAGLGVPALASAQGRPARFLGREEIVLYGIGLKVEPAHQTVPKDIATIVSTFLQAPVLPDNVPPFAPDAVVKATLRGPSFPAPVELTVAPNTPFNIPPLTVPGTHTLENIRLVSGGDVLLRGAPEQVTIDVIERLLITQVTARALTAAEIRERGIMFDRSNFQAYNFSAAFAIQDRRVDIDFSVVLPQLQGAADVTPGGVTLPPISAAGLPQLKTLIPDTLKLQTQIPNLSVVGFTLQAPALANKNLIVPAIPGVIVIPGDIGFLNQYFSVLLMVGNVAPAGSGLDVSDLSAEILLPAGRLGPDSAPLRMAQTAQGPSPSVRLVVQPGADGRLGTADDIGVLRPGDSGNAEFLVEGRREGSHVIEMAITGTLHGLPVGPIEVHGRAAGAVLVRNPRFTLTFTHPETVAAGEPYSLDVTVTNTSDSPANFVQLALYPRNVSGAAIVGEPTRSIEEVAPGDSATVSFDLVSRITGKVTAATLDSDDKVAGRFELKAAVGELGVPVSPDTLVLPKEAASLPKPLRDAALGLLGKAYAVSTAPAAALPPDVRRFSRKIVIDRAVEVAEAGLRHTLREPLPDTAAQLAMDFAGSNYARLASLVRPADLAFEQENFTGFDELRRRSNRGDVFATAVANELSASLGQQGAAAFHHGLAEKWSYRPGHISVLVSAPGALPVSLSIVDPSGRRVGGTGAGGKVTKEIPFSDLLPFTDGFGNRTAEMALLTAPLDGLYTVRLTTTGQPAGSYIVSVVRPGADGLLQQSHFNVGAGQVPAIQASAGDPYTFKFELVQGGATIPAAPLTPAMTQAVADVAPTVISVIQQKDADQIRCDEKMPGYPAGRILAVLFSEEVTPASVQDRLAAADITGFRPEANAVVGVALQPGRRIAFIALRDPIGPFVARQITIDSAKDLRGHAMTPFSGPMETTVNEEAGVVTGRVLHADGTPVPSAGVRLFYLLDCGIEPQWVGIASKSADAEGRFSWDYVLRGLPDRIVVIDPETDEFRSVPFNIQRNGQRLSIDLVLLGRGTFSGTTRSESGALLRDTAVRITSLTDNSQYAAKTDANGRFSVARIPVGSIYVELVNVAAHAKFAMAEAIPFAGAVVDRDITLLDVDVTETTVKHGNVTGRVLRTDGVTPAPNVPVFVWYAHNSQPDVRCPGVPAPAECAVAGGTTNALGAFSFAKVPSGTLRVSAFDQEGLLQGEARLQLAPDATVDLNVVLVGGLGTVTGRVLTADGAAVAGATVGGGLSLVTTNSNGEFTLPDVPVGKRDIVAVSAALKTSGRVTIDLTRAGDTVNATIVLDAMGSVSGTVMQADHVTPAANQAVYVFKPSGNGFEVVGTAQTNAQGGYRIDAVRPGEYQVSSFNPAFSSGNIVPAVIKYHNQVFRADITWRGGGGRVVGTVFDDDGHTPLKAMVSLSGDQLQIAGGRVGVAFQHVSHFALAETDFTTGKFSLSGAWVGPVTVSAAGQFSPDPIAVAATIPAPNATVEVNLRLLATSQIGGVVLQPDNVHPVGRDVIVTYKSEAFRVICSTSSQTGEEQCDSIPQGIQETTVVTDQDGRFLFPIVNAGAFSLSVEDPATGKTGQIKGSVRAGETADLSIRLLGLGELTVQVFGSDTMTAIPGANVVVKQLNHPRKEVEGHADTTGTITFVGADGFSEGEFTIEATDVRNGFAGRGTARIAHDGEQVTAKVYLFDAVGAVAGRIYASDGLTPVPSAEIVVSNGAGPLAFALSAADGSYRVETMPIGDFRVEAFEARTARRAAGTGRIDTAGQEVPLNLTQAALGIVKGHVIDSAAFAPLKGWTVTLAQRSSSGLTLGTLQTTSAMDGGYLFPGTSRGTFTLNARRDGINGSAAASGAIDREGDLVDVPLLVKIVRPLTGTIAGTVLTATGAPAPNSPVQICHETRSCENPVALTADPEGNFSLPNVPLGRFKVIALSQVTHEAGSAQGELMFDGDIAAVRVVLGGLSEVRGTVERSNGSAAGGVRVQLTGLPDPGCAGESCVVFSDGSGAFAFVNVPAKTFTVTAVDPVNPLQKGAAGGPLNPGEIKQVRIVLAPAFALTGRVMLPGDRVLPGAVAELVVSATVHLFAETGSDGVFTFTAAPPGTYQLLVSDPLGSGAASRMVTLAADVALGDILLDVAPPSVVSSNPAPAASGVPRTQPVQITFSEPIRPGTINADNVALSGPDGAVVATLDVTVNDTVVTLTPLAALADETRYTLRVRGVLDRSGKAMAADYVATFTTADVTAPSIADASPAPSTGGAPIYTPIRIRFSETLDVTKFTGAPIALTGPAGAVAGGTTYLIGNTVIVFTPNLPLAQDTTYTVTVQRATDLAGRQQAAPYTYQFTTTDSTPPQIVSLSAANGGLVVENGTTSVSANVGTTHDVAVVDWYINDVPAFADRTEPFELGFRANTAQYGPAGSTIKISAIATDTSGNRGDARATTITITADQAPVVTILTPADGLSAHTGDRIVLRARATDDLGVTQIGYRAQTGNPADALTRPVSPAATDRTEDFVFYVPAAAAPGSVITVYASASDTKAQTAQTAIVITVLDATPPTVAITGATSGARVFPGQQTTVVVTAQDAGKIASVKFTASGIVTQTETRVVDPAQPSIVTSFTVTVPTTAQAGQTLTLGAIATDAAGNSASAAQVVLPVADTTPPTIALAPENGSFDAVPGRSVNVVATAEDEVGITRIDLTASGAVSFSDSKQVTPPTGSAVKVFSIPVPAGTQPGTQILVSATATDLTKNTSGAATLTLNVISPVEILLPPSAILSAGETLDVPVQISEAAPAGGLRIDFATGNADVATAAAFVVIPQGQTAGVVRISAVAGGTTTIHAALAGVPRAAMPVTVRGGIVSGIVRDARFNAVPGAQLTVSGGGTQQDVIADADGRYTIDGVVGPDVDVRALDPVTRLYGHATGEMAHRLGYTTVNVVLIPAAAIHGTVFDALGAPVAAGVRVDIYAGNAGEPLTNTFTADDGSYAFPLVTLGDYRLEASALDGRRGRTTVLLSETGVDAAVNIAYLGTGTVTGTVRLNGTPVPNAQLTFRSWSIFGFGAEIVRNATSGGTFTFTGVPLGSFSIVARDEATGQAGSASGSIAQHQQSVDVEVNLANYGTIEGRVFASDGVTPVAGARVRLPFFRETVSDADGRYRFEIVPLATYSVEADDAGTRGYAKGTAQLSAHGAAATVNLVFLPQGRLLVTVVDPGGVPVPDAFVTVRAEAAGHIDVQTTRTAANGTVLVDHVLAGAFTASASYGAQHGQVSGTVAAGEIKPVSIELSPTGSLAGTIYQPDGQTPAAGARVTVVNQSRFVVTGIDGTFRIDGLALGRYDLLVSDAANRLRARTSKDDTADDLVITSNGQVVTREFTFLGLGTVTGRVINPDGSSAQNMYVQIASGGPGFQSSTGMRTDGGGFYRFENIVVGGVRIVASDLDRQLYGERTGLLDRHDAELQLDVPLTSNAIALPKYLYDANNLVYDVQPGGTLGSGASSLWTGNNSTERGAMQMDVTVAGATTRFTGPEIPTIEDGGREVAVRQENLGGLSVTRKIFVPRAGYFTRYLEIFRNPTAAPVTIDVDLTSFPHGTQARVARTSSGDAIFDVASATPDDWLVTTRNEDTMSGALLFQGAAGTARAAASSFQPRESGFLQWAKTAYGWRGLTIGPGETVALMHFGVEQLTSAAAIAAAGRLALLPPEALAGLSPEEVSAVRNFALPAGGISTVAPLPALTGTVTGHVFEHDHTTAVAGATVRFVSNHVLFGRTIAVTATSEGQFTLAGALEDDAASVSIPEFAFTVQATHPASSVASPAAAGVFAAPGLPVVTDLAFTNTAVVSGIVRRHNGSALTQSGSVTLAGTALPNGMTTQIGPASTYRLTGVPLGTFQIAAFMTHPQGTALSIALPLEVTAGQAIDLPITLPPTGTVTGTVLTGANQPASNVSVVLEQGTFRRSTTTDSGGHYTLTDVPEGPAAMYAVEPLTELRTTATAAVVRDAATQVDFKLTVIGSVRVQVQLASGQPATGSYVKVEYQGPNGAAQRSGSTNALGVVTLDGIPAGVFTATASHPGNFDVTASAQGTVVDATPVQVALTLPAAGSVQVTVTRGNNVPVFNSLVRLTPAGRADLTASTNNAGVATFNGVPSGNFSVRANHPANRNLSSAVPGTVLNEGTLVPIAVTLPPIGSVSGTVKMANNAAVAGVIVQLRSSSGAVSTLTATTNTQGGYAIADVPGGPFTVTVEDFTRHVYGGAAGSVDTDLQTVTANIVVQDNAVALPLTLIDANGLRYDIQRSGRIDDGSDDAYDGGLKLWVQAGAAPVFFADAPNGVAEDAGREIGIRQTALEGLEVTRKVFVPSDGYFARFLEVLRNPGVTPITVSAGIETNLGSDGGTNLVATSSGDLTFDASDRWLVTDDTPAGNDPAVADVIAGDGAASLPAQAAIAADNVTYRWNAITIQPGQSAILMHFAVQQRTRARAIASAMRLAQLPPEALAGLSPEEIAAIVNFAVPADGSSPLEPMPRPSLGTVTGRVLGGDGVSPVPNAIGAIVSAHPIFQSTSAFETGADGRFAVSNVLVGPFTSDVVLRGTGFAAPAASGDFAAGETSATLDVVFTNAGTVRGNIRRSTGADTNAFGFIDTPSAADIRDGAYVLPVVQPGTQYVHGVVTQLTQYLAGGLNVSGSTDVVAGQTSVLNLPLQPLGHIAGTVTTGAGLPAAGVSVSVTNWPYTRTVTTDANGGYLLADVPAIPLLIAAIEPATGVPTQVTVPVVAEQTAIANIRLVGLGVLSGVISNPDGSAAAGAHLELTSGFSSQETDADASGAYAFSGVPTDTNLQLRVYAPGFFSYVYRDRTVRLTTNGETLTANVTVHAVATVRVHVANAVGNPLANYGVYHRPFYYTSDQYAGETNSQGYIDLRMPEGPYSLLTYFSGVQLRYSGEITAADHGRVIDVTLRQRMQGSVNGTVYAGDGQTRMPYATVELSDSVTQYQNYTYADELGHYDTGSILLPATGFIVRAYAPGTSIAGERTAAIQTAGAAVTADVTVPVAVIRGTATYFGGSPVPYPDVFATQAQPGGDVETFYAGWTDEAGHYMIFVPAGDFTVMLRADSGLTASRDAALPTVTTVLQLDLQLPPTGNVSGRFLDAAGQPIQWTEMLLTSPGLASTVQTSVDGAGNFSFTGIPLGPFTLMGCTWDQFYQCESVSGQLTAAGQTVTRDVRIPRGGSLEVRVFDATGNPAAWAQLHGDGITRYFDADWSGAVNGTFNIGSVPPGTVLLTATDGDGYGVVEANVLPGRLTEVDVHIGNATAFTANLDGTDGFRYDVRCNGNVSDGGSNAGGWHDAYDSAYSLYVDGAVFPCVSAARLAQDGRELVLGPARPFGDGSGEGGGSTPLPIEATRRIFSPAQGGFVRYFDVVTNKSSVSQTVGLEVRGNYGPVDPAVVLAVPPAATGNTFAVMTDSSSGSEASPAPAIATVFAGPSAPAPPAGVSFANGNDDFSYRWSVTLAPGQSAAVLHFAVQRAPGDGAGAQAQAQALANLTDPAALDGLSPEDRALVVNFAGLGGAPIVHGSIDGRVVAADGATPVADASVAAIDTRTGRVLANTASDAAGVFHFVDLYPSAGGVRIVAAFGADATAESLVTLTTPGQQVSGVVVTLPLRVLGGTVRYAAPPVPVAFPIVIASRTDGSAETFRARTTAGGAFGFLGLPAGSYVVTAMDAAASASVRVAVTVTAGPDAPLDLVLPAAAACAVPATSLVSWWAGEGDAADRVHQGAAGTANASVAFAPGKIGQAFSFNGAAAAVSVPVAVPLQQAFSIEAWVMPRIAASATPQWIASRYRAVTGEADFELVQESAGGGAQRFSFLVGTVQGTAVARSTTPIELGRFYHLVASYDGQFVRLFVDGVLEGSKELTGSRPSHAAPIRIGRPSDTGDAACDCAVDELQLFERALTAAEVQASFAAGVAGSCDTLQIVTETIPASYQEQPYSARIRAVGGAAPVTFAITSGAPAPGLVLGATGLLEGTPSSPGSYSFVVTATDALGATATATLTQACGTCVASPANAVAFWSANGDSLSGVGAHHAYLADDAAYGPGVEHEAFAFTGFGTILSTTPLSEVKGTFTIEFWANPSATRASTVEATSGSAGAGGQRYAIAPEYRSSASQANAGVSVGTNGVSVFEHGPSYLPSPLVYDAPITGWTHIAVVYRNNRPSLYLNGVLVREGMASSRQVYLSKQFGDMWGYGYYQGLLDEIGMYSRALGDAEIAALAATPVHARCPQ